MSETKFTPGPWHVVGDADPEIHTDDGTWITGQVCSGAGDEHNDGMANAHLIASAPDLYAACERTLKELKARHKDMGVWAELQKELRAALAAARGESHAS